VVNFYSGVGELCLLVCSDFVESRLCGGHDLEQRYRDFEIRLWCPRDRTPAADLTRQVLAEYSMDFEPDGTDRDVVRVEDAYWKTGGEFWVVTQDLRLVGSGGYHACDRALGADSHAAELRKFFLYPSVRGLGLGRYLLGFLESAAAAKGFTELWLETSTKMKDAIALYERNGYHQPPTTDHHIQRCDTVYFKRLISGP